MLHPALRSVVKALSLYNSQFIPEDESLRSMSVILKKAKPFIEREAYKADGIVRTCLVDELNLTDDNDDFAAEILLLETSNGYNKAKNSKSAFDHHKTMFGLLAMVKHIADEYNMASYENLAEICFYFAHAYEDKIRLWSLYTPMKDKYVMKREWKITAPVKFLKRNEDLYPFMNHFCDLKKKLCKTIQKLKKLREEHYYQAEKHCLGSFPVENLLSAVVEPSIKNLTFDGDSKGIYEHLPNSVSRGPDDNQSSVTG